MTAITIVTLTIVGGCAAGLGLMYQFRHWTVAKPTTWNHHGTVPGWTDGQLHDLAEAHLEVVAVNATANEERRAKRVEDSRARSAAAAGCSCRPGGGRDWPDCPARSGGR